MGEVKVPSSGGGFHPEHMGLLKSFETSKIGTVVLIGSPLPHQADTLKLLGEARVGDGVAESGIIRKAKCRLHTRLCLGLRGNI